MNIYIYNFMVRITLSLKRREWPHFSNAVRLWSPACTCQPHFHRLSARTATFSCFLFFFSSTISTHGIVGGAGDAWHSSSRFERKRSQRERDPGHEREQRLQRGAYRYRWQPRLASLDGSRLGGAIMIGVGLVSNTREHASDTTVRELQHPALSLGLGKIVPCLDTSLGCIASRRVL